MREWNKIICYENLAAKGRMLQSNLMQKTESLRRGMFIGSQLHQEKINILYLKVFSANFVSKVE